MAKKSFIEYLYSPDEDAVPLDAALRMRLDSVIADTWDGIWEPIAYTRGDVVSHLLGLWLAYEDVPATAVPAFDSRWRLLISFDDAYDQFLVDAEALLSDAVSQGNVPIYSSAVGMTAIEVPVGIIAIRVNGWAVTGDGGDCLRMLAPVQAAGDGKIISADGRYWEVVADVLKPAMFGLYTGDGVADDDPAVRAMIRYALRGHICRFTKTQKAANDATIVMIDGDHFVKNGVRIESVWGITIKLKAGADPTYAVFCSDLVNVDATTGAFQSNKQRPEFAGLFIDCNGYTAGNPTGNTTGHGILCVADAPFFDHIYIVNAPWCGLRLQHTGLADSEQGAGLNMLHALLRGIRIDNFGLAFRDSVVAIDQDMATGVWIGESQNGKITDGWLQDFGIVSGPRGLYIGSSAGWHGTDVRIANVDDGAVFTQPNRTHVNGIQIDDFGKGWDVVKRTFYGVFGGRMLVRRAHCRFSGQVQCAQEAGKTADFIYYGFYGRNPTAGILDCEMTADFDIVLDDGYISADPVFTNAGTAIGFGQDTDGELTMAGRFDGTVRRVTKPYDLPLGSRVLTGVIQVTGDIGFTMEVRGQLDATVVATPTAFSVLTIGGIQAACSVEIELVVSRNNGYAMARRKARLMVGRFASLEDGYVSAAVLDTIVKLSKSAGVRDVTDIAVTATLSDVGATGHLNTVTFLCQPTFVGTGPDTAYRLTWNMKIITDKAPPAVVAA